jgi:peptide deformylase
MSAKDKILKTLGAQGTPLERIRTFGDPVLKQQTKSVTEFDAHLEKLVRVMMGVMDREEGVGLAANQIGVCSRVVVWRHPDNEDERYVFINPVIVDRSEACCTVEEGCLSVPGATMEVTRCEEVTVEAQDVEGNPLRIELSGMPARIAQHEIDHLDGILIVDRTSTEERARVLKELRERTLAG